MGDGHSHQHDSLDHFFAQLLADVPESQPIPISWPPPPPPLPLPPSTSSAALYLAAHHSADLPITCQWVIAHDHPFICGETLSEDPKLVGTHFRNVHDVRGNEKVIINCHWHSCRAPPMQRGSLIRHVLSVHLGLLRWQCGACGRVFTRKGTGHTCADPSEGQ